MPENQNQPREYDAVLGGKNPPPVDGVVLGGLEGAKQRFVTSDENYRLLALSQLINHRQEGWDLVIQALKDPSKRVQLAAYKLLGDISELKVKQAILEFNPYRFFECVYTIELNRNDAAIAITETGLLQWVAYDLLFQSSTEDEKQNLLQHFPLQSEVGVDYNNLRNLLASGEWLQANLETGEKIQEAVGKKTQPYYHILDLHNLSQTDLRTIDQLWVKFSNNHFGFSVQKRILLDEGCHFYEKRNRTFGLYKFNSNQSFFDNNIVFDIYKQLGWLPSRFEKSQFTFNAAPIGSLPMITHEEIRGGHYYQIPLIYRSDL